MCVCVCGRGKKKKVKGQKKGKIPHTQNARTNNKNQLAPDRREHVDAAHRRAEALRRLEVDGEEVAASRGHDEQENEVQRASPDDALPQDRQGHHSGVAHAVLPEAEEDSSCAGPAEQADYLR